MGRNKAPTTDLSPGSLPADHLLVQLGVPKGSNNFVCVDPDGVERLVELGTKIRKTVLATRGDFAIIKLFPPDPTSSTKKKDKDESGAGSLAAEVVFVASNKDVRDWKKAGEWPAGFGEASAPPPAPVSDHSDSEDEEEEEERAEEDDQSDEEADRGGPPAQ